MADEGANNREAGKIEAGEPPIPLDVDRDPVTTVHEMEIGGRTFAYEATTGMLPLKSETGEVEAGIFFVAYRKLDAGPERPLLFSFNGGPGSSSVWLHLGCVGPKRVRMLPDGQLPPPPFTLEENSHTWLEHADLVFIDPVGTGFSRPAKASLGSKYWSLTGDIESVGEFIRLYLTRYQRRSSPLYLVGESYGTTRAAGLAGHLIDRGIAFSGILLISSILNFQTARFSRGNDLPYVLFLPTYTATAFYHGRLAPELSRDLKATLWEVEAWAEGDYTVALGRGDRLSAEERARIAARLARYTGLSSAFVERCDLRVEIFQFCKELLRDAGRTVGRLDSRFTGRDASGVTATPDYDPSMAAIRPPYTALLNDYVRRELGYHTDAPYHILGGERKLWETWDWGSAGQGHPDTSEALRSAFVKNPYMRLFVASGYFDLATPYFATEYTLAHSGLDAELRAQVVTHEYEAGHMMYIHQPSLLKLKADVDAFLAPRPRTG